MELSVIIVNWNSKDFVNNCLKSIYSETEDLEFEVIVVDGGSFDGCGKMIEKYFPQVRFLQLQDNMGFASANNAGFDLAKGRKILFLNPDTEVVGAALKTLCDAIEHLEKPGVVGCRLINSDRSLQDSCVMAYPTVLNQLLNNDFLRKCFPKSKLWGNDCLFDHHSDPPLVEAVSGACVMMMRKTCEKVGRFSVGYFMYSEDIDLAYKCSMNGLKNYHVPDAVVVHHGDGSVNQAKSNFAVIMAADAIRRFFVKYRGGFYALLYRFSMGLAAGFRMVLLVLLMLFKGRRERMILAFDKWRAIFRWSLGREKWVLTYE